MKIALLSLIAAIFVIQTAEARQLRYRTKLDGSTIEVALTGDNDADGVISYKDTITVTAVEAGYQYACVATYIRCNQNGTLVLAGGLNADCVSPGLTDSFTLSSQLYQGGQADCVAAASGLDAHGAVTTFAQIAFQIEH